MALPDDLELLLLLVTDPPCCCRACTSPVVFPSSLDLGDAARYGAVVPMTTVWTGGGDSEDVEVPKPIEEEEKGGGGSDGEGGGMGGSACDSDVDGDDDDGAGDDGEIVELGPGNTKVRDDVGVVVSVVMAQSNSNVFVRDVLYVCVCVGVGCKCRCEQHPSSGRGDKELKKGGWVDRSRLLRMNERRFSVVGWALGSQVKSGGLERDSRFQRTSRHPSCNLQLTESKKSGKKKKKN